MLTIELPPDVESRLKGEASRRGVDPTEYATKLIEEGLTKPAADQASIDVLTQWERDNDTDDPEEIARRQVEFEEFKDAMNRNRLEMEGPLSRKIYP